MPVAPIAGAQQVSGHGTPGFATSFGATSRRNQFTDITAAGTGPCFSYWVKGDRPVGFGCGKGASGERRARAAIKQLPEPPHELDYDRYLPLLHTYGFKGPLLLHGLSEAQVPRCVAFLREKLARVASAPPSPGR